MQDSYPFSASASFTFLMGCTILRALGIVIQLDSCIQREYEEFKIRVNALVAKAQKVPEEGWIMQDGTPWPGNNTRDHPGMIQVNTSPNLDSALVK